MSVERSTPSRPDAALLEVGAVLPPGTTGRPEADVLTARTYTHPALDGRRVVRLVPGTLGEADDLAMEFLGLERRPGTPGVGQVRRETLGFPAWALVHDPANGHHALALVKDVERLARLAEARPGVARDGFDDLGARLARSVPHFLPSFYEQAARIYLEHDHGKFAATFFARAREAERTHALPVDEESQRAAYLEFAFAGALSVKSLREYAKDVARRLDPAGAWEQFRRLVAQRCAAGLPPYATLPRDARAMIRASGLPGTAEECRLLADVVASPAAERASGAFWTAFRPALSVLAAEQPWVRARLLELMPRALGLGADADGFWLSLLAETGADRLLTGEDQACGEVNPADWLTRWSWHRSDRGFAPGRCPATLALAERMAPRLRAEGRPVDLFSGRWELGADLDLLDLCLAEKVPLTFPGPDAEVRLSLDRRLRDARPGARDLGAVAADPRTRPLLRRAVGAVGRYRPSEATLEAMAAHPVVSVVLREWLEEAAFTFTGASGPAGARRALERLRAFAPVAERVAPGVAARVAACPVARLLGHALRSGLLDELHWPALEEALDLLEEEPPRRHQGHRLLVREA